MSWRQKVELIESNDWQALIESRKRLTKVQAGKEKDFDFETV